MLNKLFRKLKIKYTTKKYGLYNLREKSQIYKCDNLDVTTIRGVASINSNMMSDYDSAFILDRLKFDAMQKIYAELDRQNLIKFKTNVDDSTIAVFAELKVLVKAEDK